MKNKKIISFILLGTILASVTPCTAFASTTTTNSMQEKVTNKYSKYSGTNYRRIALSLAQYVTRLSDGTLELNIPKNVEGKLDSDILAQIKAGVGKTNQLIKLGNLKSRDDLTVYSPNGNYSIESNENDVVYYWWGEYDVYMDSGNTNRYLAGLAVSTAAAVAVVNKIAALQSVADLFGVIGAAYYGEIAYANADSTGVVFSYAWVDGDAISNYVFTGVTAQ